MSTATTQAVSKLRFPLTEYAGVSGGTHCQPAAKEASPFALMNPLKQKAADKP
ncbi:MAG TPA: hypothetical protein VM715_21195 [Candidatus Acidoferrum sp.]|nr:hypothetical protein [Candidatus Acidoferrum sp.]